MFVGVEHCKYTLIFHFRNKFMDFIVWHPRPDPSVPWAGCVVTQAVQSQVCHTKKAAIP